MSGEESNPAVTDPGERQSLFIFVLCFCVGIHLRCFTVLQTKQNSDLCFISYVAISMDYHVPSSVRLWINCIYSLSRVLGYFNLG